MAADLGDVDNEYQRGQIGAGGDRPDYQIRREDVRDRQQRAAAAAGPRGSFVSAHSTSLEELRKAGGRWDLSREPEEKVS